MLKDKACYYIWYRPWWSRLCYICSPTLCWRAIPDGYHANALIRAAPQCGCTALSIVLFAVIQDWLSMDWLPSLYQAFLREFSGRKLPIFHQAIDKNSLKHKLAVKELVTLSRDSWLSNNCTVLSVLWRGVGQWSSNFRAGPGSTAFNSRSLLKASSQDCFELIAQSLFKGLFSTETLHKVGTVAFYHFFLWMLPSLG